MATRFLNESTGAKTGELGESQMKLGTVRSSNQAHRARCVLLAIAVVSTLSPSTGCMIASGIQRNLSRHDALDEFMVEYRNSAWSARAWLCRKDRYRNHCFPADLEAGFRQGYADVAAGGNGCLPAVCPRAYWGWQYQSADGQSRMNAWFEGYPLGVQAAEQDGIGHWGQVGSSFPALAQPQKPVAPVAADAKSDELLPPISELSVEVPDEMSATPPGKPLPSAIQEVVVPPVGEEPIPIVPPDFPGL